jgi:ankyrin repeat protein
MKRYSAAVQYAQETRLCSSPIPLRVAGLLVALAWSSLAFCGEIHQAARNGDLAKVEALLKENPDLVFAKDKGGDTPLFWAVVTDRKDISQVLLDNKADVNAKSDGIPLLHMAILQGYTDEVQLLLANKADVNSRDKTGATPLQYATGFNRKDIVELLLANKADVNARDLAGRTPLYVATAGGYKDIAELLRQHGGHE